MTIETFIVGCVIGIMLCACIITFIMIYRRTKDIENATAYRVSFSYRDYFPWWSDGESSFKGFKIFDRGFRLKVK